MTAKLLIGEHLEFGVKEAAQARLNATLLDIICRRSNILFF